MRLIDADALKELFSEVIGHIAQKPEMNGNLEHMIRASAMVIQMIDDAPTVQPDTTTHDSIPVETGKNDGDGTSGDCINRQQAIEAVCEEVMDRFFVPPSAGYDVAEEALKKLPSAQPERKTGRWIPFDVPWYRCSECGAVRENKAFMEYYCPNCGADMRGDKHETD